MGNLFVCVNPGTYFIIIFNSNVCQLLLSHSAAGFAECNEMLTLKDYIDVDGI